MTRHTLKQDAVAALTGTLILLPQGIAYAVIAGLPPEYGLYGAMVPAIVGALFGSSMFLVTGPTASASIVVFTAVSVLAVPGSPKYVELVMTLTLMVGLYKALFAFLRLGVVIDKTSHSVIVGFTAGAACLIASSQFGTFFGIEMPLGLSFLRILHFATVHMADLNPYVTAVALITLVCGIASRLIAPKLPYMLTAMICGSVAAFVMNRAWGEAMTGIRTLGGLPSPWPHLTAPVFSIEVWSSMAVGAAAIALLGATEAVAISRAFALRAGHKVDGNQEILAQSLANLAGSVTSGYLSSGSFSRTAIHCESGARTPLANVFCAGFTVAAMALVAPLVSYLPIASMASILVLVSWFLIDRRAIARVMTEGRVEITLLILTFLASLVIRIEHAVFVGITLSLLLKRR